MKRPYTRIHKRFIVVTAIMLVLVLGLTAIIVLAGTRLSGKSDRIRFSIQESELTPVLLGGGVSLNEAESANLLWDASFEPLFFRQSLNVYSGDATTLTVSSEEAGQGLYTDDFFTGATARVLTQTDEGLTLKKTARVIQYGINRVGVFQPVQISGDIAEDQAFLDFARMGDASVGVGERGLIVQNVASQSAEIVESGFNADLTGVCANDQWLAACSVTGDILFSPDGRDWTVQTAREALPLRAIAMSDQSTVVAVGDQGSLAIGHPEEVSVLRPFTQANLTDITYQQSLFVAVGENNMIMVSQNGLVWREAKTDRADDWQAIDYRDGRFIVVGRSGIILTSEDGLNFQFLSKIEEKSCLDVVILSRQQLIILDDAGAFLISNDGGQSWQQSSIETGMISRVITSAGKDKILSADQTGQIGLAQLVAEIKLDSPLREGRFHSGDIVFLEKSSLTVPEGLLDESDLSAYQNPWDLYGSDESRRTDEDHAPHAGTACLMLKTDAASGRPAIASQKIDLDSLASFGPNEVLQISIWMKQDGVTNRSAKVWLTGPFNQIGTTFSNVGSTWKKYTYAFVIPTRPGGYEGQTIRLNIAADSGSLWIDRVFLGRLNESPELLADDLQQQIDVIAPQTIRMNFLGIGSRTVPADSWSQAMHQDSATIADQRWISQRGSSLHAALTLAAQSQSNPWLVIDSFATETDILQLIEYLAAPISEPFGRIRQSLGMTLPWTSQFQKIYLEFCDTETVWLTDRLRADSVNRLIETISQSNHYQQIKGQIVLIDGMQYEDGVMLSKADYHASDLNDTYGAGLISSTQRIISRYWDQIPRNPDKPPSEFPEFIRSALLTDNALRPIRLADVVDLALYDLGHQSGLINLTKPSSDQTRLIEIWACTASIVSQTARGSLLDIQLIQPHQTETDGAQADAAAQETLQEVPIRAYGFTDDTSRNVVLINRSDQTQTCQIISELDFHRAAIEKYDESGTWLSSQILNRTSSITLLPGSVVVIRKEISVE